MGIVQSLPVCFCHCETEASPLSSVLIPILVNGWLRSCRKSNKPKRHGMLIQLPRVWSDAAGGAQPWVSMSVTPLQWLSPAAWDLVASGYELLPKFNTVSAKSTKNYHSLLITGGRYGSAWLLEGCLEFVHNSISKASLFLVPDRQVTSRGTKSLSPAI